MTKLVVGLLDSLNEANKGVDDLASSGFDRDAIGIAHGGGEAIPKTAGDRAIAGDVGGGLTKYGVPEEDAQFYAEGVRRGGTLITVICDDARARNASEILDRHGAVDIHKRASEWYRAESHRIGESTASARISREREGVLPVVEEELEIGKRHVDTGGKRMESRIRERPVEEVKEEIVIGREEQERNERIRETARRTEVDVQAGGRQGRDEGFLEPDDEDFRKHFQSYYSRRGEDYLGFRDAYRYGATMSQYTSKDWPEIEEDLHRDWDRDHPGTWGKFREAIHYGWEKEHRRH